MPSPYSNERLAGVEAVLWAIDNRCELQDLAVESADQAELIASLMQHYGFDEDQCNFVISLSAGHMTKKYRVHLSEGRKQLRKELADGQ
ncbi:MULTISPECIES: hypothetical protein [unclassified Rhodococcus (in: high G+C Gram-positive bacteria)]|uniref:hypothetical protein n=1 Tax=unclassified Rhodococcus (in: high G+C Gram-positive bacteria) TaxID=192944 RepID=UPI0033913D16